MKYLLPVEYFLNSSKQKKLVSSIVQHSEGCDFKQEVLSCRRAP